MIDRWQPLAFVAAVTLTVCAGTAAAQTVVVKGAPAGSPSELVLNGTRLGSATVDAEGLATLTVPQPGGDTTSETDVHVFVDRCGDLWRVHLVGSLLAPPAAEGACARQAIAGLFVLRRVTTIVIEVGGSNAVLWLTQGRAPASWLRAGEDAGASGTLAPTGLVLFGSPGLAISSKLTAVACGDVPTCTSETRRLSYAVGAAYWFTPFLAAEAQYVVPDDATVEGNDTNLRFNSSLEARLLTMAGTVGGPIGRSRLYARAGINRHRAVLRTTQTVDDTTVTVGEETLTIRGGTQSLELRTTGWGYVFGGGGEVWLSRWIAIYGDLNRASLKGSAVDLPEGTIDDAVWLAQVGARVRIGR